MAEKKAGVKKAGMKKTPSVKTEADFLRVLVKRRKHPGDVRKLIDLATKDEIAACSEILLNAYKGNIRLSPNLIKKLARNKRQFQKLIDKSVSLSTKKKILKKKQVGGFLGTILSGLASTILRPVVQGIAGAITTGR